MCVQAQNLKENTWKICLKINTEKTDFYRLHERILHSQ